MTASVCLGRQLEVLRNSEDGSERGSLLWLLDHTTTPMVRRHHRREVSCRMQHLHR